MRKQQYIISLGGGSLFFAFGIKFISTAWLEIVLWPKMRKSFVENKKSIRDEDTRRQSYKVSINRHKNPNSHTFNHALLSSKSVHCMGVYMCVKPRFFYFLMSFAGGGGGLFSKKFMTSGSSGIHHDVFLFGVIALKVLKKLLFKFQIPA